MSSINAKLSAAYGITPYGKNGMEIIRNGASVKKFTDKRTAFENWEAAVKWARSHPAPTPPAKIGGTPVRPIQGSEVYYNEQTWITLIPSEGEDSRVWEFSLTTGRIIQTMSGTSAE
jgi:hypothetical protein